MEIQKAEEQITGMKLSLTETQAALFQEIADNMNRTLFSVRKMKQSKGRIMAIENLDAAMVWIGSEIEKE